MHWDVVDLREFYSSSLGRVAARVIRNQVRAFWPDLKGSSLLGLGYTSPFLSGYRGEAVRVLNFMPGGQGVVHWPSGSRNLSCLVEDLQLPLGDASMDRILLVHAVESSEALGAMLTDIWRVLAPGGRLMVVVPNRLSLWARADSTPYGHGRPFSKTQLINLLRRHQFSFERSARVLYFPPFSKRFLIRSAFAWETAGKRVWPQQGGVLIAEATKRIYALTEEKKVRVPLSRLPQLSPEPARRSKL